MTGTVIAAITLWELMTSWWKWFRTFQKSHPVVLFTLGPPSPSFTRRICSRLGFIEQPFCRYRYSYTPISAEHSLSWRKRRPEYLWDVVWMICVITFCHFAQLHCWCFFKSYTMDLCTKRYLLRFNEMPGDTMEQRYLELQTWRFIKPIMGLPLSP